MNAKQKNHSIDSLFSFLLLLVFFLFTVFLAKMGSAIYKSGVSHLNENYTSRTAIAYLTEKVRQHDKSGSIFLTSIEDLPAIAFFDTIEEADGQTGSFLTYVYFSDHALYELFVRESTVPEKALGTPIVELSDFEIEEIRETGTAPLLSVTAVSPKGDQLSTLIPLRSQ